MAAELFLIRAALQDARLDRNRPHKVWTGSLGRHEVLLVQCDIGKVNAAIAAELLIGRHGVDLIVNIGSSGAVSPELDIGDLVLATEAVQHDVDLSGFGLLRGEVMFDADLMAEPGQLKCRRQAAFATDARLRELAGGVVKMEKLVEVGGRRPRLHQGRVVSGDGFLNDAALGRRLWSELGALCVDMEAAAIAHACDLNGTPLLILRAISDRANGDSPVDFPSFLAAATDNYARIVEDLIALL